MNQSFNVYETKVHYLNAQELQGSNKYENPC